MADGIDIAGIHDFVGRVREIDALARALEDCERAEGGVYLVRGEAGIGKSRVAREIVGRARARGFGVGIGHCLDGCAGPAYEPFVRALGGTRAGRVLESRLARDAAEEVASEEGLEDFHQRIEAALRTAAAERPQLLVLEDLHWADTDSLRLLRRLERGLQGCAFMAIGTQRSDEPHHEGRSRALADLARVASVLPLGPLGESEVSDLVARWSGERPSPALVRAALRRSGGNPLFLCELIALVISQHGRLTLPDLDAAGVPDVLQHLIERRLGDVGPDTASLLARGALLGDPFELVELATWLCARVDDLLPLLEPAERLRWVEAPAASGQRFHFSHALVRDALLARIPRATRALWHREVAAMLEAAGRDRSESELARLAEHHRGGLAPVSIERAMQCSVAAAALARREGAPGQAAAHLTLALDSLRGTSRGSDGEARRRCELLLALGEVRSQSGERGEARRSLVEAAKIAQRLEWPEALARAAIGIVGHDEDPRGVDAEAVRWVGRARAALPRGDTPLRAALLSLASRLARVAGDASGAEAMAREAVSIAERSRRPDAWASAAHALHSAIRAPDGLGERLDLSRRMVEAACRGRSRRTEVRARQRFLTSLLQAGDIHGADDQLLAIDALARDQNRPAFLWHALALAAGRELRCGSFERAEATAAEAAQCGRRAGMRNAFALYSVQLFHVREAQGRLAELRPAMQQMVERNPQVPSLPLIIPLAAMQEGDESLVRTSFEPLAADGFDDVPDDDDWLAVISTHARVAAWLRDGKRCELLLAKLRPYAQWCVTLPDGQHWEGSAAHPVAALEAVVGRFDAARHHFRAALACHRRAGAPALVARTLLDFGGFEAERGDVAKARDMLREARALFERLGVSLFVEQCDAALASRASCAPQGECAARSGAAVAHEPGRWLREGVQWRVEFAGSTVVVPHRKGMSDLAILLAAPGREFHVLDLMTRAAADPDSRPVDPDVGPRSDGPIALPRLDLAAVRAYRARLAERRTDRDAAVSRGDLAGQRAADEEIEWLEAELRRGYLGGPQGREVAREFSQRARKAVFNRLRSAIARIAEEHPALGSHLRHSVRTGVLCAYQPERRTSWVVADR